MELTLTNSQANALNALNKFIGINTEQHRDETRLMKFSGAAGTGKTFLISLFLEEYTANFPKHKIACIAPSHKAKKNLANNLGELRSKITEISTVARFLGLRPEIADNGSQQFAKSGTSFAECLPSEYDAIIVDESWMIGSKEVEEIAIQTSGKVIFVGDKNQLPPVKEKASILESAKYSKILSYSLIEVVRYSGDLARIAESYTKVETHGITLMRTPKPIAQTMDDSIFDFRDRYKWVESLVDNLKKEKDVKLIAYTNNACKKWNNLIREQLWDECKVFNIGDKILARKPLFRDGKIALENSTELIVIEEAEERSVYLSGMDCKYWYVPCEIVEPQGKFALFVLHEDSEESFKTALSNLAAQAKAGNKRLWKDYYRLLQLFDDITFNYAITCHKSQGSTYDATYLDLVDLKRCKESLNQMLYTALTRSKQAYIY